MHNLASSHVSTAVIRSERRSRCTSLEIRETRDADKPQFNCLRQADVTGSFIDLIIYDGFNNIYRLTVDRLLTLNHPGEGRQPALDLWSLSHSRQTLYQASASSSSNEKDVCQHASPAYRLRQCPRSKKLAYSASSDCKRRCSHLCIICTEISSTTNYDYIGRCSCRDLGKYTRGST